jgi:hypothetical protein
MSNALAIAGVSAVLEYYLTNTYAGLSTIFGGTVTVSAKAPDLVQTEIGNGATLQNQLNIFLHQVTHNATWRNVGHPKLASDGKTQIKNPPLALDLHYLLTAYGSNDWQAEALLGYALLMLHENPVLTRQDIRNAFTALPTVDSGNPLSSPLGTSGLADQIEMIKITPSTMGREEMAWIWTALKADYRPSYAFQVSVVLIEQPATLSLSFPVLHRNIAAQPITPAQLLSIDLHHEQVSAAPGDTVKLKGEFLASANRVLLNNPRLAILQPAPASPIDNNTISFVVPTTIPAGLYSLSVAFTDASGNTSQTTGSLPFAVAPVYESTTGVVQTGTSTQVTITFTPNVMPSQSVSLTLNGQSATAGPIDTSTGSLEFEFTPPLASGLYLTRLAVDGAPSVVNVNWHVHPPVFLGPMVTI